jgi:hypothetical protein
MTRRCFIFAIAGAVLFTAAEKPAAKKGSAAGKKPAPAAGREKEKKIRKLFEVSGLDRSAKVTAEDIAAQVSKMPGAPAGLLDKVRQLAKPADLMDKMVPVYAKYLDDATIDAAIAFHETEPGKKYAGAQPGITKEGSAIAARWAIELTRKAMQEIEGGAK